MFKSYIKLHWTIKLALTPAFLLIFIMVLYFFATSTEYFYHLFIASDIKELAELNKHKVLPHIFQLPLYWLKIYVSVFICMFAGFILNAIFEK